MHRSSIALKLWFPLALGIAFLSAVYLRFYSGLLPVEDAPEWPAYTAYFALSITLWSVLETRFRIVDRCYEAPALAGWAWSLAQLELGTLALVSSAAFFWRAYSFSRLTVALFWTLHALLCLGAAWWARERARRGAATWIFVIGEGVDPDRVRRECLPVARAFSVRRFSGVTEALAALDREPQNCRELLVAVPAAEARQVTALAEALQRLPIPASLAVEGLGFGEVHATTSFVVLSTNPRAAGAFDYVFSKRLVDLAVSATTVLVLSPLLAAIAWITWWRSGRPVLMAQERVGRGGRRFLLYKFRSLPPASLADSDRRWSSPPADSWGRFLRVTGLDELPQLFNVLKGDMSLVGPRPERPHFVEQFRRQLPFYSTRHRLQTGITGWAQVNGWRGDTSIARRVECDLYYLQHWSLGLDFRILARTVAGFFQQLRGARVAARGAADAGRL